MKYFKLILFIALVPLFNSCEKFEFESDADTFFHVKVDGAELPVWVKGNTASKKIVLFINGGPGLTSLDIASIDMLGWRENLEKEFAVAYYDQRGTGNAQGNIDPNSITIEQYIKDLKSIVQIIKNQYPQAKVFLMGHSFGGFIGQKFLLNLQNQDLINGWININGSTIVDIDKEWIYRLQFLEELAQEKINEDLEKWSEALEWTQNNNPILTSEQKQQWREFIGQPGEGILPEENISITVGEGLRIVFASSYNIFPAYFSSNLNEVNDLLYENIKGTDLIPVLYKIKLPVLTLWGKYDDIIPPQLGKIAFDALGTPYIDREFVLFENSGHQPFINEPDKFSKKVIDFVKKY